MIYLLTFIHFILYIYIYIIISHVVNIKIYLKCYEFFIYFYQVHIKILIIPVIINQIIMFFFFFNRIKHYIIFNINKYAMIIL